MLINESFELATILKCTIKPTKCTAIVLIFECVKIRKEIIDYKCKPPIYSPYA